LHKHQYLDATGVFETTYEPTIVRVNKPKEEITPANEISPYDITVTGLLNYTITNSTSAYNDISIYAGADGEYVFSVVDYNANPTDREYLERNYIVRVPMGVDYTPLFSYQPYLISKLDVIVPRVYVYDQLTRPIQGVEVYISTTLDFTDTIIESGVTDGTGVVMFSAVSLINYYITVYHDRVFKGTYLVKPRTSDDVFFVTIDRSTIEDVDQTTFVDIDFTGTSRTQEIGEDLNILAKITINKADLDNIITGYTINVYHGNELKHTETVSQSGAVVDINKSYDTNGFVSYQDVRVEVVAKFQQDGNNLTHTRSLRIMLYSDRNQITYFQNVRHELGQPLTMIIAIILVAIFVTILTFSGLPLSPSAIGVFAILFLGIFMFIGWLDVGAVVFGIDVGKMMYILLVILSMYFAIRQGAV